MNKNKQKAITELLQKNPKTQKEFDRAKRKIAKKYSLAIFSNSEILQQAKQGDLSEEYRCLLKKRAVRTLSGIAPVAILTKPYPCPGNCAYCPTEKNVPQSYLSNEPAVMRAIRCNYNPFVQVMDRLKALIANGHTPTKIELIVIGGTWSYLPRKYQLWFIMNSYRAANYFEKQQYGSNRQTLLKKQIPLQGQTIIGLEKALLREQRKNEKTKYQIIGLTLETRPDYINEKELWEMRVFGCTRVELGVQAIDDKILKKNKRGHGVAEIVSATKALKDFGFKVTYHIMPGLPGSSSKKDLLMFKKLFNDERFQPDQLKFYPCVVTKGTLLYKWWKKGEYCPYSEAELKNLIIKCKKSVPEYLRIIRLIRDIPSESIIAGNRVTNLRQIIQAEGSECHCIRCREIKDGQSKIKNFELRVLSYKASDGKEYFIQAASCDDRLLGFCRLRLPLLKNTGTALLRELHVYGELVSVGENKKIQHAGLGKTLLQEAEKIAKQEKQKKMRIISGVGVRGYYRKQGYRLKKTYMEKKL